MQWSTLDVVVVPLWLPESSGDAPQQRHAAAQPQLLTAEPPAAAASPPLTVAAALLPARPKSSMMSD